MTRQLVLRVQCIIIVVVGACIVCGCHEGGSISSLCDQYGVCVCHSGVGGDKCAQCLVSISCWNHRTLHSNIYYVHRLLHGAGAGYRLDGGDITRSSYALSLPFLRRVIMASRMVPAVVHVGVTPLVPIATHVT